LLPNRSKASVTKAALLPFIGKFEDDKCKRDADEDLQHKSLPACVAASAVNLAFNRKLTSTASEMRKSAPAGNVD
jgi:hypothetical protein